jgi:hypothetical protein
VVVLTSNLEAHIKHVPVGDNDDQTDIYVDSDSTPKKGRIGLVRSYAIGDISDTRPAVKGNDDDEPVTEQELQPETEEEPEELEDDLETPKKKEKNAKRKVRDLIEAHREDQAQENMEVSVTTSL